MNPQQIGWGKNQVLFSRAHTLSPGTEPAVFSTLQSLLFNVHEILSFLYDCDTINEATEINLN